jgi:hypothetical protein
VLSAYDATFREDLGLDESSSLDVPANRLHVSALCALAQTLPKRYLNVSLTLPELPPAKDVLMCETPNFAKSYSVIILVNLVCYDSRETGMNQTIIAQICVRRDARFGFIAHSYTCVTWFRRSTFDDL